MSAYVRMYDDDPDTGPAGYRTYFVLDINKEIELVGDIRQRLHPTDAARRHSGEPEAIAPRIACRTPGCKNRGSERSPYCGKCKHPKCACGRVMSRGAVRCVKCTTEDRRIGKQMRFAVGL